MKPKLKGTTSCVAMQNTKEMMQEGACEDVATRLAIRAAREAEPGKPHKDLDKRLADRRRAAEQTNRDQLGTEN